MFQVYILKSEKLDKYHIGSTSNLPFRIKQHNAGYSFATKSYRPWKLFF
ncbi:GIY-YIG nuclease family protein [Patescibacteria group bacterium]|nr:GIY-YIG nuclease family protein [Patescibacteria group bacterium]